MIKIDLADTDAKFCVKPTSSHQSGVFLGSYNETKELFPTNEIKLGLDYGDILRSLVGHLLQGKTFYVKDNGNAPTILDQQWLAEQVEALNKSFLSRNEIVCTASINVSTQNRTYLTGLATLSDGADVLKFREMLFSGDSVYIYKIDDVFHWRFSQSSELAAKDTLPSGLKNEFIAWLTDVYKKSNGSA
jgi:hypothetical protein